MASSVAVKVAVPSRTYAFSSMSKVQGKADPYA